MENTPAPLLFIVITSIRRPTEQVNAFLRQPGWRVVFVADTKTPEFAPSSNMDLLTADWQRAQSDPLITALPWKHYARKNVGYLYAIRAGASAIFDTDDDNQPIMPWTPIPASTEAVSSLASSKPWVNVYSYFGGKHSWPRGFPLEEIGRCVPPETCGAPEVSHVKIWQGIVSGDPDVDAIYRLTRIEPITFNEAPPIILPAGSYCPFNSQNTWWHRDAFPYLYLPATVTFRFTDILRGLIAQRCLWSHGWRLGFQKATAHQDRNCHDLLTDFEDEVPCYLLPAKIIRKLDSIPLNRDPYDNLFQCYEALAAEGWCSVDELKLVRLWTDSIAQALRS